MFCPVCESEYEPEITKCPDDGAELVEKLTGENTVHDGSEASFRILHSFNSPAEAEMVSDLLSQNGIRAVVQSGGSDALSPLLSSTGFGAAVLVDERDHEKAQELYSALFGDDATPLTGSSSDDDEEEDDDED
jgi:Putative prokaryotic signal transducing protein